MNLNLEGKGFVVCGGSRGLGRAVAEELVAEGARVLVVARTAEAVEQAVAELGTNAFAFPCDLSVPEDVDRLIATVPLTFGSLDGVLVNGGGVPAGDVLDLDDDDWLEAYQLLIGGPVRLLRGLVPLLAEGAAILVLTSSAVRQPIPGLNASNVLRPGVAAMVKCLARELAPGIRVNSLAPGRFDTERALALDARLALAAGLSLEEQRALSAAPIPLGRYGEPAELGRLAAFLLSPAASYVTGALLHVDGGMVSALP